jgi:hypothetical protein
MDFNNYDLPFVSGTKELMLPSSVYKCIVEMRYFKENNFPILQENGQCLDSTNIQNVGNSTKEF